jgi:uncharacterized membrane protein
MMQSRWLVIGLIVSLAVNLFLVGAAAGIITLGVRMAHQNALVRPGALVRATRDLPQPSRRQFRMMLGDEWRSAVPDLERSRMLRTNAWAAVGDAKPDAAAIKAGLAQSRQIDLDQWTKVEERVVDYVLALPQSDRTIFAQGMRRALAQPGAAAAQSGPAPAKPQPRSG